jgi:hypothetical protein
MASTQVADRGNGLHLWRVAANTLNKLQWTAEKGWCSSLRVRREDNSLSPQKIIFIQKF